VSAYPAWIRPLSPWRCETPGRGLRFPTWCDAVMDRHGTQFVIAAGDLRSVSLHRTAYRVAARHPEAVLPSILSFSIGAIAAQSCTRRLFLGMSSAAVFSFGIAVIEMPVLTAIARHQHFMLACVDPSVAPVHAQTGPVDHPFRLHDDFRYLRSPGHPRVVGSGQTPLWRFLPDPGRRFAGAL